MACEFSLSQDYKWRFKLKLLSWISAKGCDIYIAEATHYAYIVVKN